jgi:ribosomal protein L35
LTGMDSGRGRHMRKAHYLNKTDAAVIKALIPYR